MLKSRRFLDDLSDFSVPTFLEKEKQALWLFPLDLYSVLCLRFSLYIILALKYQNWLNYFAS